MTTIITAAGGNATAIDTLAAPLMRAAYAARGQALVAAYAAQGVEQAGFLIRTANAAHFEMAGGEFCGNAARAAALLLAPQGGAVSFSMSGFAGRVQAEVVRRAADFWVRCRFPGMQAVAQAVRLDDGSTAALVDLGGIVHVVCCEPMRKVVLAAPLNIFGMFSAIFCRFKFWQFGYVAITFLGLFFQLFHFIAQTFCLILLVVAS